MLLTLLLPRGNSHLLPHAIKKLLERSLQDLASRTLEVHMCSNSSQESEERTVEELEGKPFFGNDHPGPKSLKYHLPSTSNIAPNPPSYFSDISENSLNRPNNKSPVTTFSNSPAIQSLSLKNHRLLLLIASTNLSTALINPSVYVILKSTSGALNQSKTFSVNKAGSNSITPDLSKPQISVLRGSRSAPFKDALAASWASVQTKF